MNLDKLPDDLSPNEYIFLFDNRNNNKIIIEYKTNDHIISLMLFELEDKKYIKLLEKEDLENGYEISFGLRQKTIDLLLKEDIIINLDNKNERLNISKKNNNEIEWVSEYRQLFKDTGKTGVASDDRTCSERLKWFFETYPEYEDKDIVLKATEKYINSQGDSNYRFLQKAHYFIWKSETDKTRASNLASFCEEVKDEVSNSFQGFNKML